MDKKIELDVINLIQAIEILQNDLENLEQTSLLMLNNLKVMSVLANEMFEEL